MAEADAILDARGWTCPLPVLQARRLLGLAEPGEVLVVEATDPLSVRDFRDWAAADRSVELVEQHERDDEGRRLFVHRLRKRENSGERA